MRTTAIPHSPSPQEAANRESPNQRLTHEDYLRLSQMARADIQHARRAVSLAFWARVAGYLRRALSQHASVRVAPDHRFCSHHFTGK